MTDGPFRNSGLSSRWKSYGDDLVSDAKSLEERKMKVCHSMMGDVDMKYVVPLFAELKTEVESAQRALDPISEVENIFTRHPPSLLTDILQKHLIANLHDKKSPELSFDDALVSATGEWITITKNRLDEECIRARDHGDIDSDAYSLALARNRDSFAAVQASELSAALASGNKSAFRQAAKNKADEGPDEQ